MSKIEIGRWSELLRRSLGMKGQEVVSAELSPEISPVWQIESDTAEWQFLKQVRLVSAAGNLAAVAAQFPRYALINPINSGMIATVFEVGFSAEFDAIWDIRLIDVELASFANGLEAGPRDTRWNFGLGPSVSPIRFSAENNVASIAGGFRLMRARLLTNTLLKSKQPVVMTPGSSLFWGTISTNITTDSYVAWKERRLPSLEE